MRNFIFKLSMLAVAICAVAFFDVARAQTSNGYPSQPIFKNVRVGTGVAIAGSAQQWWYSSANNVQLALRAEGGTVNDRLWTFGSINNDSYCFDTAFDNFSNRFQQFCMLRSGNHVYDFVFGDGSSNPAFDLIGTGTLTGGGAIVATTSLNAASLAISGTSATINAKNICLADGTNCLGATTGSFTTTISTCTAGATGTIYYRISNNIVTLRTGAGDPICSTSTANSLVMSVPALVVPVTEHRVLTLVQNLSNDTIGYFEIGGALTSLNFSICTATTTCSAAGFTATGAKGLTAEWVASYPLD